MPRRMTHPARWPGGGALHAAREAFRNGGVLAYATESCFGLGCDPRDMRAVSRVLQLKRRPSHKGVILVAASLRQLRPFIAPLSARERALVQQYWPGPYTFVMRASRFAHPLLTGKHGTIAVRISAHPETAGLCRALGSALVSTSANLAGQVSLKTAAACRRTFGDQVVTVPGRIGRRRKPSTIIELATGRVLR